jgi:hypothetical protein
MGTEKISEQEQQQNEIEQKAAERHIKAISEEQEQVKELLRRGTIRHYFLGPETMWTREGFGIVVGGALTTFFGGFLFPKLFLYSSNSATMEKLCWAMTAIGIVILGKGIYTMLKESRIENKPISDEAHDEILEHDIAGLKKTSKLMLEKHIPVLKDEESLDSMEMLLVKGPRDYSAFSNLPLAWKLGEDGRLRYSNFSAMALYFGNETLYIYTCIFNMRNGTPKFYHTYECPYDQIRRAGFEDRTVETANQNNKAVTQNLKVLIIDAGDEEEDKLAIPVADYDVMKKYNGSIDIRDAEEAVRRINEKIRSEY